MKRAAVAVAAAGAVAAGLGVAAAAGQTSTSHVSVANTSSEWTFTPDDGAVVDLVQSPARSQLAWEVPGSFSGNTGDPVEGVLFIRPTGGALHQPDFQFDTPNSAADSAMYAYGSPTGSGYGVGAYFFSPHGTSDYTGSAGQFLTGGAGIHIGPGMSWLLGPAPYSDAITGTDALGKVNFAEQGVLGLGSGNNSLIPSWTVGDTGDMHPVMYDNMPIWSWNDASFNGPDGETLIGTVYLNTTGLTTYDEEFVTGDALYDVKQLGFGFTNMYYDPGDHGSVVDILKTPLGDWNMSWLSWLFTPPDYSGTSAGEASGVLQGLLENSALGDTFEFGQQTVADTASHAADAGSAAVDALSGL